MDWVENMEDDNGSSSSYDVDWRPTTTDDVRRKGRGDDVQRANDDDTAALVRISSSESETVKEDEEQVADDDDDFVVAGLDETRWRRGPAVCRWRSRCCVCEDERLVVVRGGEIE
jgi:hypothetical protein